MQLEKVCTAIETESLNLCLCYGDDILFTTTAQSSMSVELDANEELN